MCNMCHVLHIYECYIPRLADKTQIIVIKLESTLLKLSVMIDENQPK